MSTPFLGQINMFGGNFAQSGYAMCNGQLLPIAQNQALFSLLGTNYGGNGVQNFGLPNMQSRLPVDWGQGPGLSNYMLGQTGGSPTVTITTQSMPAHTHMLNATTTGASATAIDATVLPGTPTVGNPPEFYAANVSGQPAVTPYKFAPACVTMNGNSQPHDNLMPSLCVTFMIALEGIFPSRN